MSTTQDDDFEFDFFDEPDEETITQRRGPVRPPQGPKRAPRGPKRPPGGFTPILRLVGLIAFAILVVVLLVFWIQGCQNDAKSNAYKNYMADVSAIARASNQNGRTLNSVLVTPGIKQTEIVQRINGLAQQEQQNVQRGESLNPPGHLRDAHQHMIESLQFRVSGLRGLANAFERTTKKTDSAKAGTVLAGQAERLSASDIVWSDLFQAPSSQILTEQGVHGVAVPRSQFVTNTELTSASTFADIVKRMQGASTGGSTSSGSGLHGTGIESVTAQPQGLVLSRDSDNKVVASTDLRFEVVVKDTGDNLETKIPVTLTIQKQGTPIKQTQTIQVISPGQTKTVVFRNIDTTGVFGVKTTLKVDVTPVPHEARVDNNSYQYPVIFSLSA